MKQIIAVDIDDVLLPHFQDLINWYNQTYGASVELADNNTGNPVPWGVDTIGEAVRRIHLFFETATFLETKPFKEAQAVLAKLSLRYELVVVSARDSILEQVTRDWLKMHFADSLQDAHFTAGYSLEGKKRNKGQVCREIGAEYLIDDSLENALSAAQAGVQALLFGNYPWNIHAELSDKMVRVKDWTAVEEYFDAKHK